MEDLKFNIIDLLDRNQNIIKNEEVFNPNYVPEHFLHRKKELTLLADHFRSILIEKKHYVGKQVLVQGSVGLGKTAIVKYFGMKLAEYCNSNKDRNIPNVLYFHINCRRLRSWNMILNSILRRLIPAFPIRGFSTDELLAFLSNILEERNQYLLLCLDEIDSLISKSKNQDVLYSLIRQHEGSIGFQSFQISLILISRNGFFLKNLDRTVYSSLSNNVITFQPYTIQQLVDILMFRAERGFHENAYTPEIIERIATIANEKADTRFAIELLWKSAKIAEESDANQISIDHIRQMQSKISLIESAIITELPPQHKYIIYALCSLLNDTQQKAITSKELREKYEEICLNKQVTPRKNTQFWNYLQQLINLKLIKQEVRNRHVGNKSAGRISLYSTLDISPENVVSLLEKTEEC
jgi:cell division control protein 6